MPRIPDQCSAVLATSRAMVIAAIVGLRCRRSAALLMGLGVAAAVGCATVAEEIEFRNPVISVKNVQASPGGAASVTMQIFNPDRYRLDVRRVQYWVTSDTTRLAEDSIVTPFLIPAQGSTNVTAPLPMPPAQLAQQTGSARAGDSASYHIVGRMTVNTHLGPFTLPFQERLTLAP